MRLYLIPFRFLSVKMISQQLLRSYTRLLFHNVLGCNSLLQYFSRMLFFVCVPLTHRHFKCICICLSHVVPELHLIQIVILSYRLRGQKDNLRVAYTSAVRHISGKVDLSLSPHSKAINHFNAEISAICIVYYQYLCLFYYVCECSEQRCKMAYPPYLIYTKRYGRTLIKIVTL